MKDSCHVLALGDFGYLVTFSYRDTIHIGVATLSILRLARGAATTKIENALIFERKREKRIWYSCHQREWANKRGKTRTKTVDACMCCKQLTKGRSHKIHTKSLLCFVLTVGGVSFLLVTD